MPWMVPAAIAAGSIASSMISSSKAAKQAEAALAQQKEFTERAIAELEKVGIPSVEAQKIVLETPDMVFQYAPQLEQEFPDVKSTFQTIETDPRLQEYQSEALSGIKSRADEGLTAEEEAEISALRRGTAQQAAARDASILQNLEQRGMGGSGAELMSRMASSQAAAQQASIDSENQAKLVAQRKLEALQSLGNMAQSQQGQQFNQAAQKSSAMDAMALANRNLAANQQSTNVAAQNKAALSAAEMKQQLENTRATTANAQEQYNKELLQKEYENKMKKATALSNTYIGAGTQAAQAGTNQAANTMAAGSGISTALTGAGQLYGTLSRDGTTK